MRLVVGVDYPNRMSYVDEWKAALLSRTDIESKYLNLASPFQFISNRKLIESAEEIILLHSCTSDSNLWLAPFLNALKYRRGVLCTFVGNEYSSPTLSFETRLQNIRTIRPDILASQLSLATASWLYRGSAKLIVSMPPGMPKPILGYNKGLDFAYRGFKYPSFILGTQRNNLVKNIYDEFKSRSMKTDYSLTQRLNKNDWMGLLANTRVTASTEAGSARVFNSDKIWDVIKAEKSIRLINSDSMPVHLARFLPSRFKQRVRGVITGGKFVFGSLNDDDIASELLRKAVSDSELESKDGRVISSRHLDAVAAGTWQILERGSYSGVLTPHIDYTPISNLDPSSIRDAVDEALEKANHSTMLELQSRLYLKNSYDARVESLLQNFRH